MTHWSKVMPWDGGECPVEPGTNTMILLEDNDFFAENSPESWDWNTGSDIIAYRYEIKPERFACQYIPGTDLPIFNGHDLVSGFKGVNLWVAIDPTKAPGEEGRFTIEEASE